MGVSDGEELGTLERAGDVSVLRDEHCPARTVGRPL